MEVMYWQLFVAGSTAAAFLLSRKAALWVAVFWSFWTLVFLAYAPLVILQLGSAWGTFALIGSMKDTNAELEKTKQELSKLEAATQQYSSNIRQAAHAAETRGQIKPIRNADHYRYLIDTVKTAKSSVLILSGWISSSVVDRELVSALKNALTKGVNIYIGYGYADLSGRHTPNPKSEQALESLVEISNESRQSGGLLVVGRFNNHQKILIKDESVVVCGSHNWLSNRAGLNREHSFVFQDEALAKKALKEFRPLVERHRIV